jgi:hypothetical protein
MELGKRMYSAATPESDTSCDVFGEGKTKMRKKLKMGGCNAVDMLQPIIEGDGNVSQRDTTASGNKITT